MAAEKTYKVYAHINKIDGKTYIGITGKPTYKRWISGSGYKTNRHFYGAIQKYGWDNFEHIILFENLSHDMACEIEKYLIAKYDTTNQSKGYNLSIGGESPSRGAHWTLSDETKRKMSVSASGEKNGFYGKHFTEEQLKKISEGVSGEKNGFYGKTHTKETREIISKKVKEYNKNNPYYHSKKVYCIEEDKLYMSQTDFAKSKNISVQLVSAILHGRRKQLPNCTIERR